MSGSAQCEGRGKERRTEKRISKKVDDRIQKKNRLVVPCCNFLPNTRSLSVSLSGKVGLAHLSKLNLSSVTNHSEQGRVGGWEGERAGETDAAMERVSKESEMGRENQKESERGSEREPHNNTAPHHHARHCLDRADVVTGRTFPRATAGTSGTRYHGDRMAY